MNTVADKIRAELAEHGVVSFARFMHLALYCPDCGYFEKEKDNIGKRGDFYTSVSTGPLFGGLLAFQFAEWLEALRTTDYGLRTQIIEAGAHDGKLAADILNWLREHRPQLFARIEYVLIEPSPRRREWQTETLREFAANTRWLTKLPTEVVPAAGPDARPQTPNPSFSGIFFSNELLDAFPVHRLGWDAKEKKWFEWGVSPDGDKFVWARMPSVPPSSIFHLPSSPPPEALPDGFTAEICPAAESWWRAAANSLARGKLVTIDYGLRAEEFFSPQRAAGTLRSYSRHKISGDILADPGGRDITAHVNFTALQCAGESAGLTTDGLFTQSKFLTQIAAAVWKNPGPFGGWTPSHTRQFQTLTHPEHLGRSFHALVQSR